MSGQHKNMSTGALSRLRAWPRPLFLLTVSLSIVAGLAVHSLAPAYAASPQLNCFASPGSCGYPDPAAHNVGVTDCSGLPNLSFSSIPPGTYYSGSGSTLEIVGNNVTISNLNMGDINIYASDVDNFTLNNVCINTNGNANEGASAVSISANSHNTIIENSNISGTNNTTESLGTGIVSLGPNITIEKNYIYNVGTGVAVDNGGTVNDNYMLVNAVPSGEHDEDIYLSDTTVTINHNVLLNEEDQTAAIFGDTGGGSGGACDNHLTITSNLMAGGDYVLYPCGNATSVGTSTSDIENNAFARCDGGTNISPPGDPGACPIGPDSHGYYPFGGTFGITAYYFSGTDQTWCGNHWDDNSSYINPDASPGGSSCTPDNPGGGGSSGSGTSSGSATPKTPDTGFGMVAAHPLESFMISTAAAAILLFIARYFAKKQTV